MPFEAHVERLPTWGVAMAALTIVVAVLAAVRVVATPLLIIPFIASSMARRFAVVPTDATIDAEGLWLGEKLAIARGDVTDAWFDREDRELRVTVAAKPDRLLVVHLPNEEQARRFAEALAPVGDAHRVAGVRPGGLAALIPLRLLSVVVAFVVTSQSPAALLLAVFFALGAYGFAVGTQVDAGPDALELRSIRGVTRIPYGDIAAIDVDDGRIELESGRAVVVAPRHVRDPLLASVDWTRRAHARALGHAASRLATI